MVSHSLRAPLGQVSQNLYTFARTEDKGDIFDTNDFQKEKKLVLSYFVKQNQLQWHDSYQVDPKWTFQIQLCYLADTFDFDYTALLQIFNFFFGDEFQNHVEHKHACEDAVIYL